MVRERYLRQLDLLKEAVLSLGEIVQRVFRDSVIAVEHLDIKLAERTIASETEINKLEEGIEVSICDLLALQQPIASDLRLVVSSLKITADLKRIEGLSINIAKIPGKIEGGHIKPLVDTRKMAILQHTCSRTPSRLLRLRTSNSQERQRLGMMRSTSFFTQSGLN